MMVMAVLDSSPLSLLDEGLSPTRLRKLEDWTGPVMMDAARMKIMNFMIRWGVCQ
jgi:hypothetical protein